MRIAFIINEPVQDATGGYKMVYMYANALVAFGHEVTIYYWCRKGKLFTNYCVPFCLKYQVARIISRKGPRWFYIDKRVKLLAIKAVNESSIYDGDIIIATAVNTAIPVYELNERKGKKVYFIQDYENWDYSDEYVNKTYSLGMNNIVVSNWLKNIVDSYSTKASVVISNGIDTNLFNNRNLERPCHSIVFQYRKAPYKGAKYAFQVINRLYELYPDLEVSVISSESLPADLPKGCKYYHSISPQKVAEINNKSNVFICTSLNEGYGLPGLEAMACGCIVCSSAYKGVFEYAVDGFNALISPIKDVDKMVKNVCNVFENTALRDYLAENGTQTVIEKSQIEKNYLFEHTLKQII